MAPFTDPCDTIIAEKTDKAVTLIAQAHLGLVGYAYEGFAVGREGYLDANPVKTDVIVTADTELRDRIYPVAAGTVKNFLTIEQVPLVTVACVCRLEKAEANYGLGELGVWVRITYNPGTPADVGNLYMFALAHFPLFGKTDKQIWVRRVIFAL